MELRAGYKQTEVGVIPEAWDATNVSGIASPIRNAIVGGPFGSDLVSNDYVEDGIPVVRGQNMSSRFVSGSFVFVSKAKANSLEANLARPGDLVFTQRGTLGQVSVVPHQPYGRYLISQSQMKLTLNRPNANSLFYFYVFSSGPQQAFIRQGTIQTGVPHINLGILRSIPVQRPLLAEQEVIAEALSDADALIESLQQLLTKKRQVKQGAMQELLTGKRRLPGFNGEWGVEPLGDVTNTDPESLGSDTSPSFAFNYIALEDVDVGTLRTHSEQVFLTAPSRARRRLRRNDVLVSTVRPNLQSHLLFTAGDDNWVCSTGFCVVRCKTGVAVPGYVYAHMFEAGVIRQIDALLSGSNYPAINSGDVRALHIPFPEYQEQAAIVATLSAMDAEIAALEAKLAKARNIKQGMMQELLTGRIRLV